MPNEQKRRGSADRDGGAHTLRRRTDLVEDAVAWLLTAAGLLLVTVAIVTGAAVHAQVQERADLADTQVVSVPAVLLEAALTVPADGGPSPEFLVPAAWTGPDGRTHTGPVRAPAGATAGSQVRVWVDLQGVPTRPPVTAAVAVATGALAAIGVLLIGAIVVGAAWMFTRRAIAGVNAARWEREWARVAPEWTGRH